MSAQIIRISDFVVATTADHGENQKTVCCCGATFTCFVVD